jgi:hypothetical protein
VLLEHHRASVAGDDDHLAVVPPKRDRTVEPDKRGRNGGTEVVSGGNNIQIDTRVLFDLGGGCQACSAQEFHPPTRCVADELHDQPTTPNERLQAIGPRAPQLVNLIALRLFLLGDEKSIGGLQCHGHRVRTVRRQFGDNDIGNPCLEDLADVGVFLVPVRVRDHQQNRPLPQGGKDEPNEETQQPYPDASLANTLHAPSFRLGNENLIRS